MMIAVECRIDRGADDAARLVSLQRRDVRIEINDGDTFETPLACLDRIEHAGIVASVTRIRLHEQRMLHVVAIHDVTKLRGRADLLSGRLIRDVLTIWKIDRIDHVDMAIDLRLIENRHVCRSNDVAHNQLARVIAYLVKKRVDLDAPMPTAGFTIF